MRRNGLFQKSLLRAKKSAANRFQQMTEPLSDLEMSNLMASVGPFEDSPHIAVAVSGGADSMALTILAAKWVHDNGGTLSALSVDHARNFQSRKQVHVKPV